MQDLTDRFPYWFARRFAAYGTATDAASPAPPPLLVDAQHLMALLAPRGADASVARSEPTAKHQQNDPTALDDMMENSK